jgi:hypothetical protein
MSMSASNASMAHKASKKRKLDAMRTLSAVNKQLEERVKEEQKRREDAERRREDAEREREEEQKKREDAERRLGEQLFQNSETHQFSIMKSPSSLTADKIAFRKVDGTVCAHQVFIDSLMVFCDPAFTSSDQSVNDLVGHLLDIIQTRDGTFLTHKKNMCEMLLTSVLSAQLQKGFPECWWFHQMPVSSGQIDICAAVPIGMDVIPRVVIEVSTDKINKLPQLFGYVNNLDGLWKKGVWLVTLGIMLLAGDANTIAVNAYYKCRDGNEFKIATANLFEGSIDRNSLGRLMAVIKMWTASSNIGPELTPPDGHLPYSRKTVLIGNSGNGSPQTVTKVFDYRRRSSRKDRRQHLMSLKFIPQTSVVFEILDLAVIRYPFIAGKHVPQSSAECANVLKRLKHIHKAGFVHLDIRASNVLFGTENVDSAIIDFDFCGKIGEACYPENYNTCINDGARHEQAVPGALGAKKHDCFALWSVFMLFQPVSEADIDEWKALCEEVKLSRLYRAARLCKSNIQLELISRPRPDNTERIHDGTGSPI